MSDNDSVDANISSIPTFIEDQSCDGIESIVLILCCSENEHQGEDMATTNISEPQIALSGNYLTITDSSETQVIQTLHSRVFPNTNLRHLELHHCSSTIIHQLLSYLPPKLETLLCLDCDFSSCTDSLSGISQQATQSISTLRLLECTALAHSHCVSLGCTILPHLTCLDFRGTILDTMAMNALAFSLHECKTLKNLILSQTGLIDETVRVLCHNGLRNRRATMLRKLVLRDNQFWSFMDVQCLGILQTTVQHLDLSENPQLRILRASDKMEYDINKISSKPESLVHTCMSSLDLEACQLNAETVKVWIEALKFSCLERLQHINLSCNPIGDDKSATWTFLKDCTSLQSLDMTSCRLTDNHVDNLVDLLSKQERSVALQRIDLQQNGIRHGVTVARLLKVCPSLEYVNLQFNSGMCIDQIYTQDLLVTVQNHCHALQSLLLLHPFEARPILQKGNELYMHQLQHWLRLNRAGRKYLLLQSNSFSLNDWVEKLALADEVYGMNALYYWLRQAPHLLALTNLGWKQNTPYNRQ